MLVVSCGSGLTVWSFELAPVGWAEPGVTGSHHRDTASRTILVRLQRYGVAISLRWQKRSGQPSGP